MRPRYLTVFLVIVVLVSAGVYSLRNAFEGEASTWKPAKNPFSIERCLKGGCEELLNLPLHRDDALSLSILVDRDVDDEISQWSDCLSSIGQCVDRSRDFSKAVLLACVGRSLCPQVCKEGFEEKVEKVTAMEKLWRAFDEYFIAEGGECVP